MRVLGIDLGAKRIGLAISDPEARIAFPLHTLEHKSRKRDLDALCELIREREVARVVVGLPIHLDGSRGPEAEGARRFAEQLEAAAGVPVELVDERWTTREAERTLRESGRKGKKRKAVVDAVAASILLRTWLEMQQRGRAGAPAEGGGK